MNIMYSAHKILELLPVNLKLNLCSLHQYADYNEQQPVCGVCPPAAWGGQRRVELPAASLAAARPVQPAAGHHLALQRSACVASLR